MKRLLHDEWLEIIKSAYCNEENWDAAEHVGILLGIIRHKDADIERLRKIAEAAREYRGAIDKGVRAGAIGILNLPYGAEYGVRADRAAEKLDALLAEEGKR